MGSFLFGSKPKMMTATDPGVSASNQYFMNLAQQPRFTSPESSAYRKQMFGEGRKRAEQGAAGAGADLGFGTQHSGMLFGKLADIGTQYELGQAGAETEAEDRARGQVFSKMGAPQQTTAMSPGTKGLFGGLLGM